MSDFFAPFRRLIQMHINEIHISEHTAGFAEQFRCYRNIQPRITRAFNQSERP